MQPLHHARICLCMQPVTACLEGDMLSNESNIISLDTNFRQDSQMLDSRAALRLQQLNSRTINQEASTLMAPAGVPLGSITTGPSSSWMLRLGSLARGNTGLLAFRGFPSIGKEQLLQGTSSGALSSQIWTQVTPQQRGARCAALGPGRRGTRLLQTNWKLTSLYCCTAGLQACCAIPSARCARRLHLLLRR